MKKLTALLSAFKLRIILYFGKFRTLALRTHPFIHHADEVSATALFLALVTRGKWETPLPGDTGKSSICATYGGGNRMTFNCDGHKLNVLRTRNEDEAQEFCNNENTGHIHIDLDVGAKYGLSQQGNPVLDCDLGTDDIRPTEGAISQLMTRFDSNPVRIRLDHHQAGFPEDMVQPIKIGGKKYEVGYSSFGLAWLHFGRQLLEELYPRFVGSEESGQAADVHEIVRNRLVAVVDGLDTGTWPDEEGKGYSYSNLISSYNAEHPQDEEASGEAFAKAVLVAYENLLAVIRQSVIRVAEKDTIRKALEDQEEGNKILIFDKHLHWDADLPVMDVDEKITYVVYPGDKGEWMVQAVPVTPGSFTNRKPLPEDWAGLRDSEFAEKTGVEDGIFCHAQRFIGGARSKAGAIALAEKAIK